MMANEQVESQQPTGRVDYKSLLKSLISRIVFVYFISSIFKRSKDTPSVTESNIYQCKSSNILNLNEKLDVYFYVSENQIPFLNDVSLIWKAHNIDYRSHGFMGFSSDSVTFSTNIPTTYAMQNNGSIYGHFFVVKNGHSPSPNSSRYDPLYTFQISKRLNKYKRKVYKKTHNLLTGQTTDLEAKEKIDNGTKSEIISHWHPNVTLNIVVDNTSWVFGKIPHPIDEYVEFCENDPCHYKPILYINDFWNLATDYYPINTTSKSLNLTLTFSPIALFKWQMYVSQNMKNKWVTLITEGVDSTSSDIDTQDESKDAFKKALLDTNPYLLLLTILISIVHSVFEILAFKNDIQFWKSRQSLEGISIRSVFFNILTSFIVLLYVMDNETNFMVKMTIFVGMLIDAWKITKCVDITFDYEAPKMLGIVPKMRIRNKSTYVESETKKYDKLAFKYLSWALFPLLVAYAIYSVFYQEHKGWYSFILNMLYGFLLTFGFIMMTPQLFINYKLKSVAHLPWRMLTYKALNTFIDDIFAFVIHMPTMYRIGCFRDDIIFFIYLYQRWIYKTDMKRVNEFGTSGEEPSSTLPAIEASRADEGQADEIVGSPTTKKSSHDHINLESLDSNRENDIDDDVDEEFEKIDDKEIAAPLKINEDIKDVEHEGNISDTELRKRHVTKTE